MGYSLWIDIVRPWQLSSSLVCYIQQCQGERQTDRVADRRLIRSKFLINIYFLITDTYLGYTLRRVSRLKTPLMCYSHQKIRRWTTAVGHQYTDVSASGQFDLSVFAHWKVWKVVYFSKKSRTRQTIIPIAFNKKWKNEFFLSIQCSCGKASVRIMCDVNHIRIQFPQVQFFFRSR